MSGRKYDGIIVVDLEATCYENEEWPEGEEQEIIEIGGAFLNTSNWDIEKINGVLIRPNRSRVSKYCTELTSLTYEQLRREGAPNFAQGVARFKKLYGPAQRSWASWGMYDKWAIERQCKREDVKYFMGRSHTNIKDLYSIVKGLKKGVYLGSALDMENLPRDGRAHRGYVDATWGAQILRHILQGRVYREK